MWLFRDIVHLEIPNIIVSYIINEVSINEGFKRLNIQERVSNFSTSQRTWESLGGLNSDRRRQNFPGLSGRKGMKMDGDIGRIVSIIPEDSFIKWLQFSFQSRRHNCQLCMREKKRHSTFQEGESFKKVMKIKDLGWREKLYWLVRQSLRTMRS